jgi:hypothetical protein
VSQGFVVVKGQAAAGVEAELTAAVRIGKFDALGEKLQGTAKVVRGGRLQGRIESVAGDRQAEAAEMQAQLMLFAAYRDKAQPNA